MFAALWMVAVHGKAAAPGDGGAVEIDNGLVKARFTPDANGIRQEFFAARGKDWVLLAESFRPAPPSAGGDPLVAKSALYDTSQDPEHRLLVSTALKSIGPVTRDDNGVRIALRGTTGGATIEQTVELKDGQKLAHMEITATLSGEGPKLEYLLAPWVAVLDGKPDFIHAPTYKPTSDSVIGDRCFFAPLVCVQKGGNFIGLMPDLDAINRDVVYAQGARQHPDSNAFPVQVPPESVSMPTAMDLDLGAGGDSRPVLAHGMMDYLVHQHVWYQHPDTPGAMVRTLSDHHVRLGMDLMLSADAPAHRGFQMASQHLWQRYGRRHFLQPRPQAMPVADYARICYPANLHFQGYDVGSIRRIPNRPDLETWQQWDEGGHPVGGLRLYAPQWSQLIVNMGWWNNVCDALGFFYWGKRLDDKDLVDKARRMVNLALSAPQNQGLFPALYDLRAKRWARSLWNPPLNGYDPNRQDAYWAFMSSPGAYQTASASVTAGYLMEYRRNCEDDPRILPYVRRYADFLVDHMPPNGCVPAWFSEDLQPLPSLRWNADGGAHLWVLSELYRATDEIKYLEAARRAAQFMVKEVMPEHRWADFEAFYSCAVKPETFFDQRTGQWPCNTMSMSWALQGFLSLFEATHERAYLDDAAAVADYVSLFQTIWAPHFIVTAYPFGGISSQIGDAEWLDQRAHRFADPFVRIGLLTGRQDLVERGIAAARSNLTLVNHPRHLVNDIYRHPNFPLGIGPENIDHEGFPQMPLASGPSWNCIGGLAAMAQVSEILGGAHVNFDKNIACGVDGVTVDAFERDGRTIRLKLSNSLVALPLPYDQPYTMELNITGLPQGEYKLVINDQAPRRCTAEELKHFRLRMDKDDVEISE